MDSRPLKTDKLFDTPARFERLNEVRQHLALDPLVTPAAPDSIMNLPTAGIEIEMTWDQAFRDMQERWLHSPDRPMEYSPRTDTYKDFKQNYRRNNRRLQPILKSITPAIPRVGLDSYWEFSFDPTKDSAVANAELSTLYEAEILFDDITYPTHMTIAGIPTDRDAAAILCLLEQYGGTTPERIESAEKSKKGSWARKGQGGLLRRTPEELKGGLDTTAYEFRTLVTTSPEQMDRLFRFGQELAHLCLNKPDLWKQTRGRVEDKLRNSGLPVEFWQSPRENPDVWRKYGQLILEKANKQKESA